MRRLIISTLASLSLVSPFYIVSQAKAFNPQYLACTRESPTVNVRSGPGLNYKVLYSLPAYNTNYPIEVSEIRNGWGRIHFRGNYPNSYHWVKMDYLCYYPWYR